MQGIFEELTERSSGVLIATQGSITSESCAKSEDYPVVYALHGRCEGRGVPPDRLEVPIGSITVGDRFRKDVGDLTDVAESIDAIGLLQPIGITSTRELVFGLRRLRATERFGCDTITARVVYLDDPLRAERDENACRKDFTPSELVAIGRAIEERERERAKERQKIGGKKGGDQSGKVRRGETISEGSDESSEPSKPQPQARDIAAAAVGLSPQTYARAKAVVEAAESDPSLAPIVVEMDRNGLVAPAFKAVPVAG